MKKTLSLLLVIMLIVAAFSACNAKTAKADINIAFLKGPTGMGAASLMEKNSLGEASNKYNFTIAASPDQITAKLVSGELDIAALPLNAVSTLYNKTEGKIKLLAVNTLGVLYILSSNNDVRTVADLKGQTILASGKGSTAEYVLLNILSKNDIDPEKDVTVEWAAAHDEAAAKAAAGEYDIVLLPEPFVTSLKSQNKGFRAIIDITDEWERLNGSDLAMGAIAVRTEFAEENKKAVAAFLEEYAESVNFVNSDPEKAAELIEKYDIAKAAVAQRAIPNSNIVCLTGKAMAEDALSFLQTMYEYDASSVGGSLPADDFIYKAE